MNLFINTTYANIEIFAFDKIYSKLYTKLSKNNHSVVVYEVLYEMLEKEKINLKDIKEIYVVNGPGSYTGTRVGTIIAKTVAQELNIPITPINLLEILYLTNSTNVGVDARGSKYFCYDGENYNIYTKEESLELNYSLDLKINYNDLITNLKFFSTQNVKEIKINYMKNAI